MIPKGFAILSKMNNKTQTGIHVIKELVHIGGA